jgi:hypothetical protein
MGEKGLLTKKEQEFIAIVLFEWLSNKIKARWFKMFGLLGLKQLIKALDDFGLDQIPENWKLDIIPIVAAANNGEKEKVRLLVVDLMNKKIDIPKLDEAQELMVFDSFSRFIVIAIDYYMQKRQKSE